MLANNRHRMAPGRLIECVRLRGFHMTNKVTVGLQLATSAAGDAPEEQSVARWVNAACELGESADLTGQCVTVRIVDEAESQRLNTAFRQHSRPTNVLAFPGAANQGLIPDEADGELGDIVICLPLVQREAAKQQKSPDAHLAHLVVHGTLHLLGYRHGDEEAARSMEDLEIRILRELGIPDPYETGPVVSEYRC